MKTSKRSTGSRPPRLGVPMFDHEVFVEPHEKQYRWRVFSSDLPETERHVRQGLAPTKEDAYAAALSAVVNLDPDRRLIREEEFGDEIGGVDGIGVLCWFPPTARFKPLPLTPATDVLVLRKYLGTLPLGERRSVGAFAVQTS